MMKDILQLRWYNVLGAAMFSIYGAAIQAWPVAILNAFIVAANLWYLLEIYRQKEFFEILTLPDPLQNAYIQRFLNHYQEDIARYFFHYNQNQELLKNSRVYIQNPTE